MKFTVALLQINSEGLDQVRNLEIGLEACRKAKEMGADLALFPEMWNIGFSACPISNPGRLDWEKHAITQDSDFFQEFVRLAKSLKLNIALTFLEKTIGKPKNSVCVIDTEGKVILHYSKVFICNFGLEELEKEDPDSNELGCDFNCSPGDSFDVCEIKTDQGSLKIGAMICADREFPEAATQLMLNGAELIIVPNCCYWDVVRDDILKTRAVENLLGIAMTNYPGPEHNGHSGAYSGARWTEDGNTPLDIKIFQADQDAGVFIAILDIDQIREFRQREKWRLDYRRKAQNLGSH